MRAYFSEEFGQQKFNNGAGSAIPLDILKSVLVDGYGDQIVTSITRVGTTATVTLTTDHGVPIKFSRFEISGCTQPEYNGIFDAIITGNNTFTYEVTGVPATPATAAVDIHSKVPAAGWTMPHAKSDTVMALKQGGGNEYFCRFDNTDTKPLVTMTGFRTMTDKDTGNDQFPKLPQISVVLGFYIRNSASRSASTSYDRPWIIIADDTNFNIVVNTSNASYSLLNSDGSYNVLGGFFDVVPEYAGQSAVTAIFGLTTAKSYSDSDDLAISDNEKQPSSTTLFLIGSESSDGLATQCELQRFVNGVSRGNGWAQGGAYPNPVTGGLHVAKVKVSSGKYEDASLKAQNTVVNRGFFPKMLVPQHHATFDHLSTFDGSGDLVGKKYLVIKTRPYGTQTFYEI